MLGGFCRICVLFDENKTGAHRRKDIKNALQRLAKSDKISEHGDTKYHPMTCKLWVAACSFIKKETQAQVFSCEFCEIFKNTCSL